MKKIIIIASIIILVLSCEKETGVPEIIETTTGETFKVDFEANWSTGYHWVWKNRDNITVADTTDLEFIPDDPGVEGSPGTEVWSFIAKQKGDQVLRFAYQRVGTSGDDDLETEEIRVIVD